MIVHIIIYKCFYLANVHTYKDMSVGGIVQSTQTLLQLWSKVILKLVCVTKTNG